jgi:hypothetical protein
MSPRYQTRGLWNRVVYACDVTQRRDITRTRGPIVVVLPRIPA